MNLGIERFLILGCIAVVILEMPQLIGDVQSASVRAQTIETLLAERTSTEPELIDIALEPAHVNALLNRDESVAAVEVVDINELLPAQPGL